MSFKRAAIPNNLIDRVDELEKRLADLTIDAVTPVPDPGGGDTTIIVDGKHIIQDEGTTLAARKNLDFTGAGVTATDDATNDKTVVTIPGGGGPTVDTKANLEATTPAEGSLGFSNDSHELGTYTGAAWEWLSGHLLSLLFGDGSDGDVTISVDTFLDRTMYYNNLTVSAGVALIAGGFKIFVRGTLTIEATGSIRQYAQVDIDGGNGDNGTDVAGGAGGAACVAGYPVTQDLSGATGGGIGVSGDNGEDAPNKELSVLYYDAVDGQDGSAGGAGGVGSGGSGGAGENINQFSPDTDIPYRSIFGAGMVKTNVGALGVPAILFSAGRNGAAGGGGGGTGGGGGGGGGCGYTAILPLVIIARYLINNGTIYNNGGDGGNGGNGYAGHGGGGAGGAGGNGGIVLIGFFSKSGSGTIDISGGNGGSGGTGVNNGDDGPDGLDGVVIEVH